MGFCNGRDDSRLLAEGQLERAFVARLLTEGVVPTVGDRVTFSGVVTYRVLHVEALEHSVWDYVLVLEKEEIEHLAIVYMNVRGEISSVFPVPIGVSLAR